MANHKQITKQRSGHLYIKADNGRNNNANHGVEPTDVTFHRTELNQILSVYGHQVAAGEWRDYAIGFSHDKAVFSVFRRASEVPIYTIEKQPRLARKQGAYSVVAQGGLILRRGHDLQQVLRVFQRKPKLVI